VVKTRAIVVNLRDLCVAARHRRKTVSRVVEGRSRVPAVAVTSDGAARVHTMAPRSAIPVVRR
jgi:hypothetical protein